MILCTFTITTLDFHFSLEMINLKIYVKRLSHDHTVIPPCDYHEPDAGPDKGHSPTLRH